MGVWVREAEAAVVVGDVRNALEESVLAADHLTSRDSAAVEAARALADKIDAWDVIVGWALGDAADSGGRPAVPQNDNTSLPTFLKYLAALGLVPPVVKASPGPTSTASPSQQAINAMRAGLRVV